MTFAVTAGEYMNHLKRATTLTPSPAVDALFPSTGLYDGAAGIIFKFGSSTANPTYTIDMNQLSNGNLNTWAAGAPTSWSQATTGTATVTETAVAGEVVTGSAAKLTSGTGQAKIYQDFTARAGERIRLSGSMRGDGTNNAVVTVQNLTTSLYLTNAMAWGAGEQACATRSANTHATQTIDFTVETYAQCRSDVVTLRLSLLSTTAAGIAYFDDWYVWPETDIAAICQHNIDPRMTVSWRHSTDNFVASDDEVSAITPYKPTCYAIASTSSQRRYQRIAFTGTQSTRAGAIWIGELVLSQKTTLTRPQDYGWALEYMHPQMRSMTQAGGKRSYTLTKYERRSLSCSFKYDTAAAYQEARDQIVRRSLGGHYPALIVPDTSDAEVCLFGFLDDQSFAPSRDGTAFWESARVRFVEDAGPAVVS